jgi:hypothetical protein
MRFNALIPELAVVSIAESRRPRRPEARLAPAAALALAALLASTVPNV